LFVDDSCFNYRCGVVLDGLLLLPLLVEPAPVLGEVLEPEPVLLPAPYPVPVEPDPVPLVEDPEP
jgi:hypothetical protein